jgi:blocked-early-in-transport protein 1
MVEGILQLTEDIHGEADGHNRLLDGMASAMDASRGIMSGTMDRFKRVFETKSTRTIFTIVGSCVVVFLLVYYLTK